MGAVLQTAGPGFAELRPPLPVDDAVVEADRCLRCGGPHVALEQPGVEFRLGTRARRDLLEALEPDAVFLGVGMGGDVALALPGDDLQGVWASLPFVEAPKTGTPPAVGGRVVRLAVDNCLWLLYEVVDGRHRVTHRPHGNGKLPVEEWLRRQARFRHLLGPEGEETVATIQARADADSAELARSERDSAAAAAG